MISEGTQRELAVIPLFMHAYLPLSDSIIISLAMTLLFFPSSIFVFPWILTQLTIPLSISASRMLLSQTPTWFLFNVLSCSLSSSLARPCSGY